MILQAQFRYEREMYPALGGTLRDVIFPAGLKTVELREPAICGVIPDVLYCHWRVTPQFKVIRPATIIDAHILSVMERAGRCNVAHICSVLYLSPTKANESLCRLLRQGLIISKRNGDYALGRGVSGKHACLAAVELKMSRWREALDQGRSYLKFANMSFVVLDGGQVTASSAIENAFTMAGVGLLLQHAGSLQLRVRAKRFPHIPTPERFIAMQKASLLLDHTFEYPRHFLNALSQTC